MSHLVKNVNFVSLYLFLIFIHKAIIIHFKIEFHLYFLDFTQEYFIYLSFAVFIM